MLINDGQGNFDAINLKEHFVYFGIALCNVMDKYIVMTGGMISALFSLRNSVYQFDLEANEWSNLPPMKKSRFMHSSCSIDETIYVFCGATDLNSSTNSIERYGINANYDIKWS